MNVLPVSVIIPTRNGGGTFVQLLEALTGAGNTAQAAVPAEIIVVDSGSGDGTAGHARRAGARVLSIAPADFDHGGTRNRGAREATGDVLVFMTQDAVPVSGEFLRVLTAGVGGEGGPDAAFARQVAGPEADPVERFSREFNYPDEPAVRTRDDLGLLGLRACFFSNTASAISRSVFEGNGGFREPILTNEDMEFAFRLLRAGGRIEYRPAAVVRHWHRMTLARRFSRYFDIGAFLAETPDLGTLPGGREGVRFLGAELRRLGASREVFWVPYALLDAGARFLGLRMGRGQALLPRSAVRLFSGRPGYWASGQPGA